MNPQISVIIPAYNAEKYIYQAIESALIQTLKDIEVIIVVDGSTDKTAEIAQSFSDQRVRVLINEYNLGIRPTLNRALAASQGKWVAVLDADDWYAPERLEKFLLVANSENADIIADNLYLIEDGEDYPWGTLIGESGEDITEIKIITAEYFAKTDIYGKHGLHLGFSKPMYKRDFLLQHSIKYDERLFGDGDFWLDLECLVCGAKFLLLPDAYYFYRLRSNSMVHTISRIGHLQLSCQKCQELIKEYDLKRTNPRLANTLSVNYAAFYGNLAYYRVVTDLKQKKWFSALVATFQNPLFFVYIFHRIPDIISRRIDYYIMGNKSAFKIFYSKHKNQHKPKLKHKEINPK